MTEIDYSRAEVIEALEYLLSPVCTETQFDYCDEIRAEIALLKEKEARVMDADDVFVTERGTVLYIERRRARETKRIVPAILTDADTWSYGPLSSYRYVEFVHEGKLIDHRDLATYGVTWRCWTARPTEEQMRETKWGGENENM